MIFPKRTRNKFRAKRTNGFASGLEAAVHNVLLLRERAGEIRDIKCQQTVVLQDGPREERIAWKIDFSFIEKETDRLTYAEAKGVETSDYKIKLKLYRAKVRRGEITAPLEIWKGTAQRPMLVERIGA